MGSTKGGWVGPQSCLPKTFGLLARGACIRHRKKGSTDCQQQTPLWLLPKREEGWPYHELEGHSALRNRILGGNTSNVITVTT